MKRYIVLLVTLIVSMYVYGLDTGRAMLYSGSFMLRAKGCDALYRNPANLNTNTHSAWIPGVNLGFFITNNAFDLDTYNAIAGKYLDQEDKDMILNKIDQRLKVNTESHIGLLGTTWGNVGLATSTHVYGEVSLSKKYLNLLLNGNPNDDYFFIKRNNHLSGTMVQDITFGMGDLDMNTLYKKLPHIKCGFSASGLIGYADVQTTEYHGDFHTGFDGFSINQQIQLQKSIGGVGFKGMLAAQYDILPNLRTGVTLDNVFGSLSWFGSTQYNNYKIEADSIFLSDIDEDFYHSTNSTEDIDPYSQKIPLEMSLSAMYRNHVMDFSIDWTQGFEKSVFTDNVGRIAIASEFYPISFLPVQIGVAFGNNNYPWRVSYGAGFRTKVWEFGVGCQSFESAIPGYKSKGVSIISYMTLSL